MCFQLVEICVIRQIALEVLRLAECIEISKYGISLDLARVGDLDVIRVGVHAHDFFLDLIRLLGQVNAVSERFTHLRFSVDTRQTSAGIILRQHNLRLHKCLAINRIEFVDDLLCLLDHRHLILSNRNGRCLECSDVGCLADRVGEESNRDARLKVSHLDLRFYGWVSLQSGNRNEIHIIKRKLAQFRNLRLDKDGALFRIKSAGKVIQCYLQNVLAHLLRVVRIVGQRLCICNHDVNFIEFTGVLQLHAAAQ